MLIVLDVAKRFLDVICVVLVPDPVRIKLYSEESLQTLIDGLDKPEYNELLMGTMLDTAADDPGMALYRSYFSHSKLREPVHPVPSIPFSTKQCPSSFSYYLQSSQQVYTLQCYLEANGNYDVLPTVDNGDCMYAALRRGMHVPFEFSNIHLKRWLTYRVCLAHDFFFKVLRLAIAETYGFTKYTAEEKVKLKKKKKWTEQMQLEDDLPGPFSFKSYILYMSRPGNWGDEIMAVVFSLMTQCSVTILDGARLTEVRLRHDRPLKEVDVLLIHCQMTHYMSAGKSAMCNFKVSDRAM